MFLFSITNYYYTVTGGKDYGRKDSVNVQANSISRSFAINIKNDDVSECNESFKLILSIPDSTCGVVSGTNDTSRVLIRDNDSRRSVSNCTELFTC